MTSAMNFLLIIVVCALIPAPAASVDRTVEEKAIGKDVVEAVVQKIRQADIFTDDFQFLRRLAYVETRDGQSADTFVPDTKFAGIWNVGESYYNKSKDPSLATQHAKIQSTLNIVWANTTWKDLLKPLYSALSARLYLDTAGETIPQKLKDQGIFWAKYYNTRDNWNDQSFVNQTEEYENATAPCNGKMDLVAVLDGSGSVGTVNYETCKNFLANFFASFSPKTVRLGLVLFSRIAEEIFPLDNFMSNETMRNTILSLPYPGANTNTNEALSKTWDLFNQSETRVGVPKIATIFTDGQSNPKGIDNIKLLKDGGVITFAVGITRNLDYVELRELAYNVTTNVFTLDDFDVLTEFFKLLNAETCLTPQTPNLDEDVEDALNEGERRYYTLTVPVEGLTIVFNIREGQLSGYWSRNEKNPSSAVYDGSLQISSSGTYISSLSARNGKADEVVYISVEGLNTYNNYTMQAKTGGASSLMLSFASLILGLGVTMLRFFGVN